MHDYDQILLFFAVTLSLTYYWFMTKWSYWSRRNVPSIRPRLFQIFTGLIRPRQSGFLFFKKLYRDLATHRYFGLYDKLFTPTLLIRDPDLVKAVLIGQSEKFADKSPSYYSKTDLLTHFVFNLNGDKWRQTRNNLSPAFTPMKVKPMVRLMAELATALKNSLVQQIRENNSNTLYVGIIAAEYHTNIFASIMFGIEGKTIGQMDLKFLEMILCIFGRNYLRLKFNDLLLRVPPKWRHYLCFNILDETSVGFFKQRLEDAIKFRKENGVERTDILQYFIKLLETTKSNGENSPEWTFESTLSHSMILTFNGIIELAPVMSFALYEVAMNEEVQENLRKEIKHCLHKSNDQITYEVLGEMTYLHQVLLETLRKYPVTYTVGRICTDTCVLRGTKLTVEKGTSIRIPISGIHYDPEYYPEPEKFDPGRFHEDRIKSRHPYCYLPFGLGPRNCIAEKFSLLCIKTAVVTLLSTFDLSLTPEDQSLPDIEPINKPLRLLFVERSSEDMFN